MSGAGYRDGVTTDAESLAGLLVPGSLWRRLDVVASTGSTNADVASEAARGELEGRVLVALEQTAGRGRLTRRWASPAQGSVSMSLLLQPRPSFERWGWLSLMAGMAVRSALLELSGGRDDVELKWPNDVLVGGRKVCGILSTRVEHATGARAVVGIGINVSVPPEQLPVPTATSLHSEDIPASWPEVVQGVLRRFEPLYRAWQDGASHRSAYEEACASIGRELTIHTGPDALVEGRGVGVDETGRILVRDAMSTRAFAVGDVVHARLGGTQGGDPSLG